MMVLINCWVVVEDLFRKEEAIRKVDKDPIADHYGDEVFWAEITEWRDRKH